MPRWAIELVGEALDLATAELAGCLEAQGGRPGEVSRIGRFAFLAGGPVGEAMARTALSRRAFEIVLERPSMDALLEDVSALEGFVGGTYRISVGVHPPHTIEKGMVVRGLVRALGGRAVVRDPDVVLKVLVGAGVIVGVLRHTADRRSILSRDVMRRPFFSPVSIRSVYARTLVNLARTPVDGRFADPFCGGGGILMEAAALGAEAHGIDIAEDMVAGARRNLAHFGLEATLRRGDVADILQIGPLDAVATDPPYGRATSLRDESLADIYQRMFSAVRDALRPGGYLAVALPAEWAVRLGDRYLEREATFPVRVHRSLTRHFTVYRRA